jgi:glutaconate CoA-transferase subunit B
LAGNEELLACVIARAMARLPVRHVAVGAASAIPATACRLRVAQGAKLRLSLLHRRAGNPFSEGSRELFDLAGQGRIDVFFLGGAEIDGAANLNLVRVNGHRFPGSFGSAFMYQTVPHVILFREEHSRRTLVPRVEFVSARGDPAALVTGKALFAWQKDRRRFRLESVHPGHEEAEVREATGFAFDGSAVPATPRPSPAELALLRGPVAQEIAADYPDFARRVWGIN